jgi:phage-related protein (TIGR01555 family)
MLARFFNWLFAPAPAPGVVDVKASPGPERSSFFTTDLDTDTFLTREQRLENLTKRAIPKTLEKALIVDDTTGERVAFAMDASNGENSIKSIFSLNQVGIPDAQANWYGSQGFIGYQLCALLAQNWLINKACLIPARDAIRKGYELTANEGEEIPANILAAIKKANKRFKLNKHLVEFVKMGRVFGIRVALCVVENPDPDYYVKPFNPDSIAPGSYKGISQIDPYWCLPELTASSSSNPAGLDFYEPTYWLVNGKRYHKSHLVIMRGPEVADILKPSYLYGGLSLPQMIYERVYAAERTANEAPLLALTKRTTVFYTDVAKALANQASFENKLARWIGWRDNQGVKVADKQDDQIEQHDTSLTDLDAVIMTQYQIVAAAANMPATKLLGTTPKGFNASGTYEEDSYHEELESIQVNDMEPLIDRHIVCLIRSEIAPRFAVAPFALDCTWKPLDTLSSKEAAEVNKLKAETDKILAVDIGAIDGFDVRNRIAADEASGHNGLATSDDNEETQTNGEA